MGLEPAIFGLTGRHVHHYTTPPIAGDNIPQLLSSVKFSASLCLQNIK